MSGGVRAAGLALLCALLTVAGHAAGGGAAPDPALLVVLVPLLGGALVPLADRTRGPVGLLAVLGAAQFALHHLLELLHPAHAGGATTDGGRMLATHAVVTVLLAVAVRGADAAVAAVAAALARVLPRRAGPPPAVRPLAAARPAGPATGLRLAAALSSAHARRGPPVRC